jgi:hypothetical protein
VIYAYKKWKIYVMINGKIIEEEVIELIQKNNKNIEESLNQKTGIYTIY